MIYLNKDITIVKGGITCWFSVETNWRSFTKGRPGYLETDGNVWLYLTHPHQRHLKLLKGKRCEHKGFMWLIERRSKLIKYFHFLYYLFTLAPNLKYFPNPQDAMPFKESWAHKTCLPEFISGVQGAVMKWRHHCGSIFKKTQQSGSFIVKEKNCVIQGTVANN